MRRLYPALQTQFEGGDCMHNSPDIQSPGQQAHKRLLCINECAPAQASAASPLKTTTHLDKPLHTIVWHGHERNKACPTGRVCIVKSSKGHKMPVGRNKACPNSAPNRRHLPHALAAWKYPCFALDRCPEVWSEFWCVLLPSSCVHPDKAVWCME